MRYFVSSVVNELAPPESPNRLYMSQIHADQDLITFPLGTFLHDN
jgi:hypothetical protein